MRGRIVSIHAPARGATCAGCRIGGIIFVSIHAPARGATRNSVQTKHNQQFQSTLPRGERLRRAGAYYGPKTVSIHAPARGATLVARAASIILNVSIHAPARGATQGCRQVFLRLVVSIHAPARGATCTVLIVVSSSLCFNPRSRAGSDQKIHFIFN